jgi:hypothetical protein
MVAIGGRSGDSESAAEPKWGPAMQSNQVQATSVLKGYWRELKGDPPVQHPQSMELDSDTIERAAQALFEFVFSSCGRLDGKLQWTTCDESTKEGFRGEAAAVIVAAWPFLFR